MKPSTLAVLIFSLMALDHLFRLVRPFDVVVGGTDLAQWVSLAGLIFLAAACSPGGRMTMPTIDDVVSGLVDKGCQCRLEDTRCFMVEAVAGRYEGRDLSCRIVSRYRRTVRCRFEERFVEWLSEDEERPGEWSRRDAVFRNFEGPFWCLKT